MVYIQVAFVSTISWQMPSIPWSLHLALLIKMCGSESLHHPTRCTNMLSFMLMTFLYSWPSLSSLFESLQAPLWNYKLKGVTIPPQNCFVVMSMVLFVWVMYNVSWPTTRPFLGNSCGLFSPPSVKTITLNWILAPCVVPMMLHVTNLLSVHVNG